MNLPLSPKRGHSDRQVIILFCFLFQVAGQQEGEQQAEYRNYN